MSEMKKVKVENENLVDSNYTFNIRNSCLYSAFNTRFHGHMAHATTAAIPN